MLTKKDFGNYFPEADEWTKQKIEVDHYYDRGLIWNEPEDRKDFYRTATVKNVLLSKADLGRIRKICTKPIWREERWWEYIYEHENNIVLTKRREAENRKYERRQRALKDRAEHTEPLPEQLILDRADRLYFHERHYLYYKKRGCRAQIACSKCGGVTDIRWKSGISYESQFERLTEEPRQGDFGTCPMCGARGEYKCQGKVRGEQERKIRPGTESLPLICAFAEAVKALPNIDDQHEKIEELWNYCKEKVLEIPNVYINSPDGVLPYILNISAVGVRSETMLHYLAESGIYVSSGSACAKGKKSHVLTAMGLSPERIDSAIRISFSKFNTKDDIDIFAEKLAEGMKNLAKSR